MPNYKIECIEKEASNAIIGAKPCEETSQDVTYFSGIRITRSALRNGGKPVVTDLAAPVYYEIDGNVVTLRGSSSSNDQYYTLPLDSANLTAAELQTLLDDCNCCGAGGGGADGNDFVNAGTLTGNNLVLGRTDGGSVTVDLSGLAGGGGGADGVITGATVTGSNLTITRSVGADIVTDVSSLLDNVQVVSGAVAGNNLTLTLSDASTVVIDVSTLVGGGGGGDDWGAQVIQHDPSSTSSGDGTVGSPLLVPASGVSIYDAGLGFIVMGTPGITVTSSAAGVYDIDIPSGGIMYSFDKQFTNAGTEFTVGGEVQLNLDWNTAVFNTSFANAKLPDLTLHDPAGTEREPGAVFVTPQTTAVAGGTTATTVANINGLGVPINLKGVL